MPLQQLYARAGWANCGHDVKKAKTQACEADPASADNLDTKPTGQCSQTSLARTDGCDMNGARTAGTGVMVYDLHPAQILNRTQRIEMGLKCKQLIDAGRCAWLRDQLGYGERLTYIPSSVSLETTLVVGKAVS